MILRSDEEANQEQAERDQKFRGNIGKGLGAAASLGTAAIGGSMAARIVPFLNQYIPAGLAVKGINKVSPKLGAFLRKGQEMGLNVEEGLEFLKEKFGSKQSEPPKENRNIIQQYSPELNEFLNQEIQKGRSPIEAGAVAQLDKRFVSAIEKMSKDHKAPFSAILETVFGNQSQNQPDQTEVDRQQALNKYNNRNKRSLLDEEQERFQKGYGQQQQQGPGAQALMSTLQKIQAQRGAK